MKIYISKKYFYTNGLNNDKEIVVGLIPGLSFKFLKKESDLVFLSNISTNNVIIVTEGMLESELFLEKRR